MLTRLCVRGFRNLPDLGWDVGPGSHLVGGRNGAGKTSLLEAVYLAATARSFRTTQIEDCAGRDPAAAAPSPPPRAAADDPVLRGESSTPSAALDSERAADRSGSDAAVPSAEFAVRAEVAGPPLAELAVSWGEAGLVRTLDGKTVPLATYLGVLPVVAWTAREDEILAGVPERRRRMIDGGLVAVRAERIGVLARHRRVLAHKRELLRRRQPGLEAWNGLFAASAWELVRLRAEWVDRLATHLAETLASAGCDFPPIALRYEPSPAGALSGVDAIQESLSQAVADEIRLGRPCIGPHLDRLSILWGDVDVSRVASAGERKALGLLLAAAQAALVADVARAPTLLVDDVDAELDLEVLGAVWRVLADGRQVVATSSRRDVPEVLEGIAGGLSEWGLEGGEPVLKSSL